MHVMHKGVQPFYILVDPDLVYLVNITRAALRVDNPSRTGILQREFLTDDRRK